MSSEGNVADVTPKRTPQSLVNEQGVRKALEAQCGPDAVLRTWNVHDFANKGDNYACVVSSVMVTYMKDEQKQWTSFVVKLNPCRAFEAMKDMTNLMFVKEGHFYTKIIPELNKALESAGQTGLRVPKCYHIHLEIDNEVLYLEDLRDEGFKMADRKKGLDVPHLILVLEELGRFHAASVIFKGSRTAEEMVNQYPCLEEMFVSDRMMNSPEMQQFSSGIMDGAATMIKQAEGYSKIAETVRCMEFFPSLKKQLVSSPPFEVICHGDCWTNNFLFKYDENGSPSEVRLLDLQITRVASPTMDLNYLIYSSTNGQMRKDFFPVFLSAYHANFNNVLASAGIKSTFTSEELKLEFRDKNIFGFLMGLMLIPMMVASAEEVPDFDSVEEDQIAEYLEEHKKKGEKAMANNPLLRPRLLDMIDEMVDNGVIDK